MTSAYNGLVVIIPTRNRASLAMNAIQSVIHQPGCDSIQILVSDNSTEPHQLHQLSTFCKDLAFDRLRYITPPQPMPMARHWDWVLAQALEGYAANHFLYLTDRMVFRSSELRTIVDIAAANPQKVLSYSLDIVNDYTTPIRLERHPWSGKLLEIDSRRLLLQFSQSVVHNCIPRMLNSIAPRSLLHKLIERFGDVFVSIAPDFCFAFRCLEVVDSFLYYDRSVLVHYALDRSNGATMTRGVLSTDSADFMRCLGDTKMNFAAPVPEFISAFNTCVHEYCLLKRQTQSVKFPDIDKKRYFEQIAVDVATIENPQLRNEMQALLCSRGYMNNVTHLEATQPITLSKVLSYVRRMFSARRVLWKVKWLLTRDLMKPIWLHLAHWFGIWPPGRISFEFDTVEQAIQHANRFPLRRRVDWEHLESLRERGVPFTCVRDLEEVEKPIIRRARRLTPC